MYSLSQQFNSWDSVPKIKEYHVEKVYSQQFILQNVFEALFVVAKAKQKTKLERKWKHFNGEMIGERIHKYFKIMNYYLAVP